MQTPLPLTRELVLIGGGHAHALVLRMWGMKPLAGVRVTVINPEPSAPYTGMLPGYVAGHYQRDELDIDIVRLARFAGARVILDRACALDPDARTVTLAGGRVLPFHAASVDIGITSDLPKLPGFAAHAVGAKPLGRYAKAWAGFRRRVATGEVPPELAVIGGGVGGVELTMAMHHALAAGGAQGIRISIVERDRLLDGMAAASVSALRRKLGAMGAEVIENVEVSEVCAGKVILSDGREVASRFTVGVAGARPQDWLRNTGLALHEGFISVDAMLRALGQEAIFAVGDCAHLAGAPRPKAGVFAVRQAPVLYDNLRAVLSGGALRAYRPQKDYLKLISTGGKAAIADWHGLRLQGRWLWRWKDHIDRTFMDQFTELRAMTPPPLPVPHALGLAEALGSKPMCGGCGAKVGSQALGQVLDGLQPLGREDVLVRPADDAATLIGPDGQRQVISTDHLRAFTEDPWTMARIAAVHALGDVWAMGAKPQAALATIILPRMSAELQQVWLAEIMAAAAGIFHAEGAEIVGGHTSLGQELTIGFTVTGLTAEGPVTLAGARPGDVLVLTKPIGSGTVMAGEMAMRARGAWVAAALTAMATPQGKAAELLAGAHAMTDVTGFGLAGHVQNIARASGIGIELELAAVPLMDGAEVLAAAGVRSTIYPDNRAACADLVTDGSARSELLFDPQTAGGLLAAVPECDLAALQKRFAADGLELWLIGRCTPGASVVRLV
ncbi:MAG: selenide, water dikinase SelD [Paracoccaceae bacterium]